MSIDLADSDSISCSAVVMGGDILRLDRDLPLDIESRVQVTIIPQKKTGDAPPQGGQLNGALEGLRKLKETHPLYLGGRKFNREELYERD